MKKTSAEMTKMQKDKTFDQRLRDIRRVRGAMADIHHESSLTPNLDRIRKSTRLKVV